MTSYYDLSGNRTDGFYGQNILVVDEHCKQSNCNKCANKNESKSLGKTSELSDVFDPGGKPSGKINLNEKYQKEREKIEKELVFEMENI